MGWAKRPVAHVIRAQAAIDFAVNRGLNMGLNMGITFCKDEVIGALRRQRAEQALLWWLGAPDTPEHKLANLADIQREKANFSS